MRKYWPEDPAEFAALVDPAFAEAVNLTDAAARFGVTRSSLESACRTRGYRWREKVGRPPVARLVEASNLDQGEPLVKEPPPPIDWTGARPTATGAGLERRVLLGDMHIPYHDLRACAAALAVIRAVQPHRVIQMGDFWNMGAVSHHPRHFGGPENHSRALRQGIAFVDAVRRAAPGAEVTLLLGNHDTWADEYEDAHPEFAGLMAAKHTGLEQLGVKVVSRREQPYVLGPVAYTHGYGGGEMSAKKYAIEVAPAVGVKYVKAGHHHTLQCHHHRNGCEGWIVGWLGRGHEPAFDYAKNRDHWRLALVIEDVIGDRVTTTPVRLENGAALFGGRMIAA